MGAGNTCIGNTGLCNLLQKHMTEIRQQDTDTEEDSSSQSQDEEDNCEKLTALKGQTSKIRDLSSESEEELEGVSDGEQQRRSHSDSTKDGKNLCRKRVKFAKRSEDDIEHFSWSDDEGFLKAVRCVKENESDHRHSSRRENTTSGFKKAQSRDEGNTGTLDSLLGRTIKMGFLNLLIYSLRK